MEQQARDDGPNTPIAHPVNAHESPPAPIVVAEVIHQGRDNAARPHGSRPLSSLLGNSMTAATPGRESRAAKKHRPRSNGSAQKNRRKSQADIGSMFSWLGNRDEEKQTEAEDRANMAQKVGAAADRGKAGLAGIANNVVQAMTGTGGNEGGLIDTVSGL